MSNIEAPKTYENPQISLPSLPDSSADGEISDKENSLFIGKVDNLYPSLAARMGTVYARLEEGLEKLLKKEEKPSADNTRTSGIREVTAPLRKRVVEKLHEEFPYLTPDALSIISAAGVGIGAIAAAIENEKGAGKLVKAVTAMEIVASSVLDAFDGELARLLDKLSPGSNDFFAGQLKDAVSDRFQELFLWLSHYYAAKKREDKLGEVTAMASIVTGVLPSLARAYAEKQGYKVSETGVRPDRFFGSRLGRTIVGIVGAVYPEIKGVSVQSIGDGLVTVANMINTYERLNIAQAKKAKELSQEKMHEAQVRFFVLGGVAAVSLGVAAATLFMLRNKKD